MAIVTDRSNVESTPVRSDDSENGEDVPLGTFLYDTLPNSDFNSVEAVCELRERE